MEAIFGAQFDSDGVQIREEYLSRELRQFLLDLFDKNMEPMLQVLRSKMSEPIATCDMQLVQSVCNLVECFISDGFNYPRAP